VSSMRHLLSKCGTPVRLCADPTMCRPKCSTPASRASVAGACPAPLPRRRRLQGVLHAEDAPHAGQRRAQRRLVIEITLDDVDALGAPAPPPSRFPACAFRPRRRTRYPAAPARPRRPDGLSLRVMRTLRSLVAVVLLGCFVGVISPSSA